MEYSNYTTWISMRKPQISMLEQLNQNTTSWSSPGNWIINLIWLTWFLWWNVYIGYYGDHFTWRKGGAFYMRGSFFAHAAFQIWKSHKGGTVSYMKMIDKTKMMRNIVAELLHTACFLVEMLTLFYMKYDDRYVWCHGLHNRSEIMDWNLYWLQTDSNEMSFIK